MKKLLLLAALCCTLPMAAQWGRRPTPNDTLQSTRVLPDGKVLFQIYAPQAQSVSVSGDLPWGKPIVFEKAENGVWKGVCEGLDKGLFRYSFTVDGVRVQDPKAPLSAEQSSLLQVGEGYVKDVPHGAVAQRFYWSKTLGQMRRMHVWTLAEGKMVPMVVVMPNGTINVPDEVPPFAEDMVTSIIPFIEANYAVKTDAASRAMAGLSMGGMETMETAFLHPELFRYVWVLSASFSPGNQKPYVERIKLNENASKLNKCFKALVLTQGGPTDIAYNNCKETRQYLDAAGVKYEYMENAQAGHSWTTWRADLEKLAPTLFK